MYNTTTAIATEVMTKEAIAAFEQLLADTIMKADEASVFLLASNDDMKARAASPSDASTIQSASPIEIEDSRSRVFSDAEDDGETDEELANSIINELKDLINIEDTEFTVHDDYEPSPGMSVTGRDGTSIVFAELPHMEFTPHYTNK